MKESNKVRIKWCSSHTEHTSTFVRNRHLTPCEEWTYYIWYLTKYENDIKSIWVDDYLVWKHGKWLDSFLLIKVLDGIQKNYHLS